MKSIISAAAVLLALLASNMAAAAQDCCQRCGCNACVRKVCRLTCELKKVPETKYSCECEDFCVPGPAKQCGCICETDCDGCEHCKPNWVPQCADVYTRSKIKKTTVDTEKRVYKWVVEYVCESCESKCALNSPGSSQATPQVVDGQPITAIRKVSLRKESELLLPLKSLFRTR